MSLNTALTRDYLGNLMPLSPNATNEVTGTALGQTLTGKKGVSNWIISPGGGSTLIGGDSGDTFYVVDPTDIVIAAPNSGINTIVSWTSQYLLPANVQNLSLQSASGGIGVGNNLNNLLVAEGPSNYTLVAGTGNDVMIGNGSGDPQFDTGAGSTTFVISQGDGNDVIANFRNGIDVVRLNGFTSLTSLAAVQAGMTQAGPDVVLNLGGGETLTFRNETIAQFAAADFMLPAYLPNMSLRFDDEFNTFTSSPTGTKGWMTQGGHYWRTLSGNNELEYYSDSSVGVNPFTDSNGVLTITAAPGANPLGLPYNSGIITTEGSLNFEYGLIEVSAKLPAGAGLWPAIWLLPSSFDWPPEIDIMEMLGDNPSVIYASTHSGANNDSSTLGVYTGDTTQSFHTYGLDWEPDHITWYFDGNAIRTVATPSDMHQPMYLLINLAVGGNGSWPGPPTSAAEFPAQMSIDYVRYYVSANSTAVSGTALLPPGPATTIVGDAPMTVSTGPGVSGITIAPASGDLTVGATVTLTVTFSAAVTVAGGVPSLALNDGGSASYGSGSGTNALEFSYTVTAGQNVANLGLASSNAFALNGATIRDSAGDDAELAAANGYSFPGTLQIDTTAPTIASIAESPGSGQVTTGGTVTLTVTFSEPIAVSGGTPSLALNDGGTATYLPGSSGGSVLVFGYTAAAGQSTADLALAANNALILNGATIRDGAGNNAVLVGANGYNFPGALVINPVAATVVSAVTASPANADLTVGGIVTLTVIFSASVTVAGGAPTLQLNDNGSAAYVSGSGTNALVFSYTVAAGQNVTDLALAASNAIALNGVTIRDAAGNKAVLTGANGANPTGTLQIDTIAPMIVSITTLPGSGQVATGGTVTLTGTFSEAVTVAGGAPTLQLNDNGSAAYVSGSGTNAQVFSYTVAAGQSVTDLALAASNAIALNGATIRDAAGNNAVLSGANGYNPAGVLQINAAVTNVRVSGWWNTYALGGGNFNISGAAGGARISGGDGNDTVNVSGTNNVLNIGDGNQNISFKGNNNTVTTGVGASTINLIGGYESITIGATPAGTTSITAAGFGEQITSTGTGNVNFSGSTGNSTVILGDGNDRVTMGGSGNSVTVGVGTSTINVGTGQGTVHAGGGADTISASGWNNLLDAGPGMNFLHGGNGNDTFVLNGANQGLDTITGFALTNHDKLDLSRTLASVAASVSLANVGMFITALASGGNTTLSVDLTGGHGTPYAFASLQGVIVTMAQLVANNDLIVP
jgi:beta-glucanase (GH16 family)/Ca2+-binding RTX toxin-like protein